MNIKTLLNSDNYYSSIETILNKCSHKTQVRFALYCVDRLEKYYDFDTYTEIKKTRSKCLELVANWLLDSNSVTPNELDAAANAAANAANHDLSRHEYLKYLFFYLVKLYLTETDSSFKEKTFNLLYLSKSSI